MIDYRDEVIEEFAAENAALREQIDTLAQRAALAEAYRDSFRMVAVAGLQHSHDLHVDNVDLRDRHYRALDDAREMRRYILASSGGSSRAA